MENEMKNFFHNISDILLAILIVAVCAGIIFWRMQIIMKYPETVIDNQQTEQSVDDSADDTTTDEEPKG